jgi:phosphatidylserine decarboxylase
MTMSSLLFTESPVIGILLLILIISSYYTRLFKYTIVIFICMNLFYRYTPHNKRYNNNILVSPAEGKITNICQIGKNVHISIFLSIFNKHTQIYPVNGTVVNRIFDNTGIFDIVIDRYKSRFNEKKIHIIQTKNHGQVVITQIAGFLPRCITSGNNIPDYVEAGEYLGMIKFGSRIDLSFVGDLEKLNCKINTNIKIGEKIYSW